MFSRVYVVMLMIGSLAGAVGAHPTRQLDSLMSLAISLHDQGKFNQAIDLYNSILRQDLDEHSKRSVIYEKALSLHIQGSSDQAIRVIDRALQSETEFHPELLLLKGIIYDDLGEPDSSVEALTRSIQQYPNDNAYFNRAVTYMCCERYVDAERDLYSALCLNPDHLPSRYGLAEVNAKAGHRGRSILALYVYLLMDPGSQQSRAAFQLLFDQLGISPIERAPYQAAKECELDSADRGSLLMFDVLVDSVTAPYANMGDTFRFGNFSTVTRALFGSFATISYSRSSFWGAGYFQLLDSLYRTSHYDTYIYSISRNRGSLYFRNWLARHRDRLAELNQWRVRYDLSCGLRAIGFLLYDHYHQGRP